MGRNRAAPPANAGACHKAEWLSKLFVAMLRYAPMGIAPDRDMTILAPPL